jgi:hypothetical protein
MWLVGEAHEHIDTGGKFGEFDLPDSSRSICIAACRQIGTAFYRILINRPRCDVVIARRNVRRDGSVRRIARWPDYHCEGFA